ncbi:beta-1,6-N-acetylglucosaminyltransferase [Pedobacter sandarakinus]|uniref:beta-1,6-N-acetylglucosaminyltransferase n=1 Tax=Pedobacter sandarakinus TaxID=353156 RepID=UPI00224795B6|nr:beta-1,6-N-acetylglucosaminyltransferase [Pedobacter sandarakinus]MCX2574877.1 glycosyltransferase [Pedobacter sandarakinus]
MKVAHIIMAYKSPQQIERMIRAMDHPDFHFFIHLDKKISIAPFRYLQTIKNVSFIRNRSVCNWGGFSFVKAVINSLSEVLDGHQVFDYYNLMSGQDYPIKPVNQILAFLKKNEGKSYVSFDTPDKTDWWSHAVSRYEKFHFTDFRFKGRYLLQRIVNAVMPKRKFPLPIQLYGSSISSWWTLHAPCARYLVQFAQSEKKLGRFMRFTWGADEFFYATILMNSPHRHNIVNDNLRLINWEEGASNPIIFTQKDLELISNSEKFFARKFDVNVDSIILDDINNLTTLVKTTLALMMMS